VKITKRQLRRIIREAIVKEGMFSKMGAKMGFGSEKIDGMIKQMWVGLRQGEEMEQELDAGGGEQYGFDRINEMWNNIMSSMERFRKVADESGLTDAQESQWKGFKKKANQVLRNLQVERSSALEEELGEEEAEQAEREAKARMEKLK